MVTLPGEAATARLLDFFEQRGKGATLRILLVMVILLGAMDYVTGYEWSFAFFYLVPVSLAAWCGDRHVGWAVSVASAVVWQASNRLAGETFSVPFVPVWNAAKRLGFFLVVTVLLTRLRAMLKYERVLSRTDFLTGVWNARVFYDLVSTEAARSQRYGHSLALAYLDLDNFKTVNDRFGHQVGDDLLRVVATTAQRSIRRPDMIARLGGDEFAILLPETDIVSARAILTRLQATLVRTMEDHNWPVTFSIGAVSSTGSAPLVDDLIRRADDLMYRAKRRGKNRLVCAVVGANDELRETGD